ncbi:LysM peptidoglycan-binding domain-containing protein [Thiohalorhabdus sp.]|uniref:LysM peptidoglycan-binding domain-containing protein n=1 Tax=Thiohalorhabdus sp. TaxID=3094134 RepID=UPI002FC3015D
MAFPSDQSPRPRGLSNSATRATAVFGIALVLSGCARLGEGPAASLVPGLGGSDSAEGAAAASGAGEADATAAMPLPNLKARVAEGLGLRPRPSEVVPENLPRGSRPNRAGVRVATAPGPGLSVRNAGIAEDLCARTRSNEGAAGRSPAEEATEPPSQTAEGPEQGAGPDEPTSFWPDFRSALTMDRVDHHQVDAFVRFYRTHEAYLNRAFERGRPFLPYILAELEKRDMPVDLALLPVVESAFRPFAYSSGRAAGIWQFTPGTGRHFGLDQNWWYDGRRDVLAATDAALDYLERLHRRYDSWLLALAAYNAGPGRVNGAIRRNQYHGKPTDFWSLDLPRETHGYVPKLIALSYVVRNTEEYGIELPAIPAQPGFAVVELDAPLDLAQAAEMADSDTETLYRLNPGLNQWGTPPKGPNRLLVPRDRAERFRERLAELDAEDRVRWVRHRIESGESLSEIASQYQTTVGVVKQANTLASDRITAGDHLLIPTATSEDRAYPLSRPQRRAATQQSGPDGRTRIMHEVDRGDSLSEIASQFDVATGKLAEWNDMAPGDTLHAGQQLAVWIPAGSDGRSSKVRYRVRRGDSLWAIAQQFNVPVHRLRTWNDLEEDPIIRPGDRLTIYVNPTQLAEHRG